MDFNKFEVLEFTVPDKVGDYDVLCTFPGHSLLMNAKMKVVK